jgi:transcriptional regulator with XRE-family HTH domain
MPSRIRLRTPAFGQWLREVREVHLQRTLASVATDVRQLLQPTGLKVEATSICKIENGRPPSTPMLWALCEVYGLDLADALIELTEATEFPGADALRTRLVKRMLKAS